MPNRKKAIPVLFLFTLLFIVLLYGCGWPLSLINDYKAAQERKVLFQMLSDVEQNAKKNLIHLKNNCKQLTDSLSETDSQRGMLVLSQIQKGDSLSALLEDEIKGLHSIADTLSTDTLFIRVMIENLRDFDSETKMKLCAEGNELTSISASWDEIPEVYSFIPNNAKITLLYKLEQDIYNLILEYAACK